MKTVQRIVLTWAMVMLTTIITMPNAYAKDQAAIVIVAAGNVYAVDSKLKKRSLLRRSKVYVGDTLVTGNKGRVQVRFIDGAVVSLRPDSELNIQKYSYGKSKSEEGSLMSLIKGGFRTITGAIGKEKYKLLKDFDKIFGLGLDKVKKLAIPQEIKKLAKQREKYREQKQWQKADEVRKKIEKLGYQIEDTKTGAKIKKN